MKIEEQKLIIKKFFEHIKEDFLINKDYIDQKVEEFFSTEKNKEISETELETLLLEKTPEQILMNFKFPLEFILKQPKFTKGLVIEKLTLTEDFIEKAIEEEYFTTDDISRFNMSTYANLSLEFLEKYNDYIKWDRMISYICTKTDDVSLHEDIINKYNLWWAISANDLPIDFIRKWKDNLDWRYLSIVKNFTNEERIEFKDHIIIKPSEFQESLNNVSTKLANSFCNL